jgi:hypothetical protein
LEVEEISFTESRRFDGRRVLVQTAVVEEANSVINRILTGYSVAVWPPDHPITQTKSIRTDITHSEATAAAQHLFLNGPAHGVGKPLMVAAGLHV